MFSDDLKLALPAALALELEGHLGAGSETTVNRFDLPYADSAKSALECAMKEARSFGTVEVGGEHLLIGVLEAHDSAPRALFEARGIDAARARDVLLGATRTGD